MYAVSFSGAIVSSEAKTANVLAAEEFDAEGLALYSESQHVWLTAPGA